MGASVRVFLSAFSWCADKDRLGNEQLRTERVRPQHGMAMTSKLPVSTAPRHIAASVRGRSAEAPGVPGRNLTGAGGDPDRP